MKNKSIQKFTAWASGEGYDTAYTYDTDRCKHIFLSPMTADLFRAWNAGIIFTAIEITGEVLTSDFKKIDCFCKTKPCSHQLEMQNIERALHS